MKYTYSASFISAQEMKILAEESSDIFKLYAYLRSKMDIATGVSGLKTKLSYQAIQEWMCIPAIRGRHQSKAENFHKYAIKRGIDRLIKIGLIVQKPSKGCFIFEHPLAYGVVRSNDDVHYGVHDDVYDDSNYDVHAKKSKKSFKNNNKQELKIDDVHDDVYDENPMVCTMIATPQDIKDIKDINNIYTSSASQNEDYFDEFWSLYPRKVGKKKCKSLYLSLCKKDPALTKVILEGIKKYLPFYATQKKQYIPNPLTWLNQGRWEDEVKEEDIPLF